MNHTRDDAHIVVSAAYTDSTQQRPFVTRNQFDILPTALCYSMNKTSFYYKSRTIALQ